MNERNSSPDFLEPVEGAPATSLSKECQDALRYAYVDCWKATTTVMNGLAITLDRKEGLSWQDVRGMEARVKTPEESLRQFTTAYPGDELCPEPEMRAMYHEVMEKWDDAVRFVAGLMGTG